jgi:hypothetical protein
MDTTLYKVLSSSGRSPMSFDYLWDLPIQLEDGYWAPSKWHEVEGELSYQDNGLHVTNDPLAWQDLYRNRMDHCKIYEVEISSEFMDAYQPKNYPGHSMCCRNVRLIRLITDYNELPPRANTHYFPNMYSKRIDYDC